jgi:hypothetical protein
MLLRGILLGIVIAIISLILFGRGIAVLFPNNSGPLAIDSRSLRMLATTFFSGVGIGFGVVMGLVIAAFYGLWLYGQHIAQQAMK